MRTVLRPNSSRLVRTYGTCPKMKEPACICLLLYYWSVIAPVNGNIICCYHHSILTFSWLWEGSCFYPGSPLNGRVHVSFDSHVPVAHYTCNTSLIEGSLTRRCDESGRWNGTPPLCGLLFQVLRILLHWPLYSLNSMERAHSTHRSGGYRCEAFEWSEQSNVRLA